VNTRVRFQPVVSNIPGSVAWISCAVLLIISIPFTYFSDQISTETVVPLAQVETHISTEGYDRKHRRLPFTIYVLTEEFSWKLESATDLDGEHKLFGAALTDEINRARDVFCIGTASLEGATQAEEARADQRARMLAQWAEAVIRDRKHTRLFTVNAGQYVGPKELQSAHQRKAIIIGTAEHDDEVNVGEALRWGLEKEEQTSAVVYSLLHHYSRSQECFQIF
jgi:hypothetical protein